MKTIICILLIASVIYIVHSQIPNTLVVRRSCLNELKINDTEFNNAIRAKFVNPTSKIQCFFDCTYRGMGFAQNGQINDNALVQYQNSTGFPPTSRITPVALRASITKCRGQMGTGTNCVKVFNFDRCLRADIYSNRT